MCCNDAVVFDSRIHTRTESKHVLQCQFRSIANKRSSFSHTRNVHQRCRFTLQFLSCRIVDQYPITAQTVTKRRIVQDRFFLIPQMLTFRFLILQILDAKRVLIIGQRESAQDSLFYIFPNAFADCLEIGRIVYILIRRNLLLCHVRKFCRCSRRALRKQIVPCLRKISQGRGGVQRSSQISRIESSRCIHVYCPLLRVNWPANLLGNIAYDLFFVNTKSALVWK